MSEDRHEVRLRRFQRGRSVLDVRPGYGYEATCSCGWSANGTKQGVDVAVSQHARDAASGETAEGGETDG